MRVYALLLSILSVLSAVAPEQKLQAQLPDINYQTRGTLLIERGGTNRTTICPNTELLQSNGTTYGCVTLSFPNFLGTAAKAQLPTSIAYEDEQNIFTDLQTVRINGIGSTSTDGLSLSNTTAAAPGSQQFSPRILLSGQGWKTNATAESQTGEWIIENQMIQDDTKPATELVFSSRVNGGSFNPHLIIREWDDGQTPIAPSGYVEVTGTSTRAGGANIDALTTKLFANPSGNTSGYFEGTSAFVQAQGAFDFTRTFGGIIGHGAWTEGNHTGTITSMVGYQTYADLENTGSVTSFKHFEALTPETFDTGSFGTVYGLYVRNQNAGVTNNFSLFTESGNAEINTGAAGTVGLRIDGASSQTANLQEWRDSTPATVASIGPTGTATVPLVELNESAGDPTCVAGNYNIKGNSTSGKLRGCENGTLFDVNGGGGSTPNYTASFTSQTSISVSNATHGIGHAAIVVQCYDNSSPAALVEPNSVTVNASTFEVIITFSVSQSGKCVLSGSGGGGGSTNLQNPVAFASLPTCDGAVADFYYPLIDSHYDMAYCDGSAPFQYFLDGVEMFPPTLGDFTEENNSTTTEDTTRGGITVTPPVDGSSQLRIWHIAEPSAPYTCRAAFKVNTPRMDFWQFGLVWHNAAADDSVTCVAGSHSGLSGEGYYSDDWTDFTSVAGGTSVGMTVPTNHVYWMQIADNSTNRTCSICDSAEHCAVTILNEGNTVHTNPDRVGFGGRTQNGTYSYNATIISWQCE